MKLLATSIKRGQLLHETSWRHTLSHLCLWPFVACHTDAVPPPHPKMFQVGTWLLVRILQIKGVKERHSSRHLMHERSRREQPTISSRVAEIVAPLPTFCCSLPSLFLLDICRRKMTGLRGGEWAVTALVLASMFGVSHAAFSLQADDKYAWLYAVGRNGTLLKRWVLSSTHHSSCPKSLSRLSHAL